MKKIFYCLILIIASCSNTSINCNDLVEDNRLVYFNGKLYTGKCITIINGQTSEEKSYKDGERSGRWTKYYPNGQTEYLGNAKKNELDGEYVSYFENGKLKAKGNFKMGYRDGIWEYYNDNGELTERKNFSQK